MYTVPVARAWWPAVGARLERGVRHQCARQADRAEFACEPFCFPIRATARAVAVLRVCGPARDFAWRFAPCSADHWIGSCLGLLPDVGKARAEVLSSAFIRAPTCPPEACCCILLPPLGGVLVVLGWLALTPALNEIRLFEQLVHFVRFVATRQHAAPDGICGLAASWLFSSRRQAHFLQEHQTVAFLKPNVRGKPAPTAWRAGHQAQNGPQAQRLMSGVPCCWGSA